MNSVDSMLSDAPGTQITGLTLSYGNGPAQFSTIYQGYEMYKEIGSDGYRHSFMETGAIPFITPTGLAQMGGYGSVLRIDGKKLSINWEDYSVGCQYNYNLQLQVTFNTVILPID